MQGINKPRSHTRKDTPGSTEKTTGAAPDRLGTHLVAANGHCGRPVVRHSWGSALGWRIQMLGEAMKTRRQRQAMCKQKGSRARNGHGDSANRGRGRVADMAYRIHPMGGGPRLGRGSNFNTRRRFDRWLPRTCRIDLIL